jgi:hypothetical protein
VAVERVDATSESENHGRARVSPSAVLVSTAGCQLHIAVIAWRATSSARTESVFGVLSSAGTGDAVASGVEVPE